MSYCCYLIEHLNKCFITKSFTHKRLKNVEQRKQSTTDFEFKKKKISVLKRILQIRRVRKNEWYEPRISICLLNRDLADSMIWVCLKFVEELSWKLHFYASLLVWDQEQDRKKFPCQKQEHMRVKFCSRLYQKNNVQVYFLKIAQ